jgi:hypothetical protein
MGKEVGHLIRLGNFLINSKGVYEQQVNNIITELFRFDRLLWQFIFVLKNKVTS